MRMLQILIKKKSQLVFFDSVFKSYIVNPNMKHDINLNRLEIFNELVLANSFTQAAKKLKQPKSRISRQLAALEAELGFSLIYRTTRQFQLTSQGKLFYQKIKPLLNQLDTTIESFTQDNTSISGNIRMSLPEDMGVELMGDIAYEFMQIHPMIHLEIHPENRIVDIIKEGFDLAIRMGPLKDSSLIQKKIGEIKLVTVASPKLFDKYPRPLKLQQLESLPFLGFTSLMSKTNQLTFYSGNLTRKLTLNSNFSSNNFFCLRSLCLKGQGFTILPNFIAKSFIQQQELQILFEDWEISRSKVQIVYPQQKEQPLRVKKFIEFLQDKIASIT